MADFNFIHAELPFSDRALFFGIDEVDFITFDNTWSWPKILVEAGIFESNGQARKNMLNIKGITSDTISPGWSHVVISKKKINICVLNYFVDEDSNIISLTDREYYD